MKRVLLLAGLLGLAAFTATALASPAQVAPTPPPPSGPSQQALNVGDSFVVPGASIGCQVTRRGSSVVVECRRDGKAKGTYGTFISSKTVRVAKFRSSRTAQVLFTARHGGKWRACGMRGSVARAAAESCR